MPQEREVDSQNIGRLHRPLPRSRGRAPASTFVYMAMFGVAAGLSSTVLASEIDWTGYRSDSQETCRLQEIALFNKYNFASGRCDAAECDRIFALVNEWKLKCLKLDYFNYNRGGAYWNGDRIYILKLEDKLNQHKEAEQAALEAERMKEEQVRRSRELVAEAERIEKAAQERERRKEQAEVRARLDPVKEFVEHGKEQEAVSRLIDLFVAIPNPDSDQLETAHEYDPIVISLFKALAGRAKTTLAQERDPHKWIALYEQVSENPYSELPATKIPSGDRWNRITRWFSVAYTAYISVLDSEKPTLEKMKAAILEKKRQEKASRVGGFLDEAKALVEKKKDSEAVNKIADMIAAISSPDDAHLEAARQYKDMVDGLLKNLANRAKADLAKQRGAPMKWVALYERVRDVPMGLEGRIGAAKDEGSVAEKKSRFGQSKQVSAEQIKQRPGSPETFWKEMETWFPSMRAVYGNVLVQEAQLSEKMRDKAKANRTQQLLADFVPKTSRCVNLINSLMALGKRAQGCHRGSCSAQTMGKMQDDSDNMNEQLTETVNRLEEILGDESISEDKAEQMRKQARRSGCMRL